MLDEDDDFKQQGLDDSVISTTEVMFGALLVALILASAVAGSTSLSVS